MSISPLSSIAAGARGADATPLASGAGGFARILTQLVGDASAHQARAEQAVGNLAAGKADNLHNVLLSMAKADLSFHLVLEIRNRLSDAYQDIMRMQI